MKKAVLYLALTIFLALLLVGCSGNQNEEKQSQTDNYNEVRETAWNFVKEKGWHTTAKGNWRSAEVTKVVANKNYELLDKNQEGREALSVSFEEKKNSVVGIPVILIDPNTNKVIGYMPSE